MFQNSLSCPSCSSSSSSSSTTPNWRRSVMSVLINREKWSLPANSSNWWRSSWWARGVRLIHAIEAQKLLTRIWRDQKKPLHSYHLFIKSAIFQTQSAPCEFFLMKLEKSRRFDSPNRKFIFLFSLQFPNIHISIQKWNQSSYPLSLFSPFQSRQRPRSSPLILISPRPDIINTERQPNVMIAKEPWQRDVGKG